MIQEERERKKEGVKKIWYVFWDEDAHGSSPLDVGEGIQKWCQLPDMEELIVIAVRNSVPERGRGDNHVLVP